MSDPAPTIINARNYRSALELINTLKPSQLPVWVKCDRSEFLLTKENFDAIMLGVLMAASWSERE